MLLVCLRSIKMAARWIFLCHWPRRMRGKGRYVKKTTRCVLILSGSPTFVAFVKVIFLVFLPICSWGRCRKCWKGFRSRCSTTKEVAAEDSGAGFWGETISRCSRRHAHPSTHTHGAAEKSKDSESEQVQHIQIHPREAYSSLKDTAAGQDQQRYAASAHTRSHPFPANPGLLLLLL